MRLWVPPLPVRRRAVARTHTRALRTPARGRNFGFFLALHDAAAVAAAATPRRASNPCANFDLASEKDWRCHKYGPLGFVETLLKAAGMLVCLASISLFDPSAQRQLTILRYVVLALLIFLTAANGVFIIQRLLEKEVCAVVFGICSTLAHLVLTIIGFESADPGQFVFVFGVLYLFGDIVKLVFLKVEDEFVVALLPRPRLLAVSFASTFFVSRATSERRRLSSLRVFLILLLFFFVL